MSLISNLSKKSKKATNKADKNLKIQPKAWNAQNNENYKLSQSYINQYANRGPFQYNINTDALYKQYKDQYIKNGQSAMRDTVGQIISSNGGYGSSYAETAGQQQYQRYLNGLNDVIPTLYDAAYTRYQGEGDALLNSANAYQTLYGNDLDAYNTNYNRWLNRQDILENRATNAESNWLSQAQTVKAQKYQSKEAQKDRIFQAAESAKDRAHTASENAKDRALSLATASKSGKSGSSSSGTTNSDGYNATSLMFNGDVLYERNGQYFVRNGKGDYSVASNGAIAAARNVQYDAEKKAANTLTKLLDEEIDKNGQVTESRLRELYNTAVRKTLNKRNLVGFEEEILNNLYTSADNHLANKGAYVNDIGAGAKVGRTGYFTTENNKTTKNKSKKKKSKK